MCLLVVSLSDNIMQDEELAVPADSCETTGELEGDTGDKSSQTTPNLSQNTPRKKMLRTLLQRKRREISTLKSLQCANLISGTKSKLDNANTAFQLLKGVISQNLLDFLQKQVTLSVNRKKGRRYDNAFKAWALTLYHISGKAYRFLEKLLSLPSKSTLKKLVSRLASNSGFTEKSIFVLKQRVQVMSESAKICTLIMDEMSLKSHLFYDISSDSIIGFESFGEGKTSNLVANSALVLMARGILSNWKQPVAFFTVNEACNSEKLKDIVDEALLQLELIGLKVVALVSDQGSNFLKFYETMRVTEDKPYLEMHGKQYFTIFDPPHLLKSIRNNLMKYQFLFDGKTATWSDIKAFFKKEQTLAIRTAPKLTHRHISPPPFGKMKVKLATQVFSHSVSAGIYTYTTLGGLHAEAIGTAQLLAKFDKIFDCCNSLSFKDGKICRRPLTASSPHLKEIEEGIEFIKSIKVIDSGTGEDRTSQLKCLKGWCITLKSIYDLWHKLQREHQISFLCTRQLNQDPLENFFGSIRQQGGNSDNPTPVQFRRAYQKLFHTNLLTVSSTNCERDDNVPLLQLSSIQDIPDIHQENIGPLRIVSTEYTNEYLENRIFKDNAMAYVTGYLLKKAYELHKCDECVHLCSENSLRA